MQANEIRIGNYVADRGGKVWQIDHWEYKDKVSAKPDEVEFLKLKMPIHPLTEYVNELKPVALTEKWLLGFGFTKSSAGKEGEYNFVEYYEKNSLCICNWGDGFVMSNAFARGLRINLKSVHQLQNLFFAITGKELTLGDGIDCP